MDYSNETHALQVGLKTLGYDPGPLDGIPGKKTTAALTKFKQATTQATTQASGSFAEQLVAIAAAEVGVEEQGDNSGARIREYQGATWYAPAPWAWCAAFVCWCYQQAAKTHPLPIARPTTPGAWDFENWARKEGAKLIKPVGSEKIKAGDIIIYTFSHIGIAAADEFADTTFSAIEGNTNQAGSREGDGVYKKTRKKSQVRSIIRLLK